MEFDVNTREPKVSLQFNDAGTKLFAQITKDNVGKIVAIYLDGAPISTPVVREEIPNGQAVISGNFTPTEAKQLVGRLNSGALPVPITLLSTQTIGAILGDNAVNAGVKAAIIGFLLVALFLNSLISFAGIDRHSFPLYFYCNNFGAFQTLAGYFDSSRYCRIYNFHRHSG